MKLRTAAVGAAALLLTTGVWVAQASTGDPVAARSQVGPGTEVVRLFDAAGERVGQVRLQARPGGVRVDARMWSLHPGFHGFHVHQTGICDPDAADGPFTSAGDHYAGGGGRHGTHAGDMPSLLVRGDGTARLSFVTDRFRLRDLRRGDGSAVMVHTGRDNYAKIPGRYTSARSGERGPDAETRSTGDAGNRAACGEI